MTIVRALFLLFVGAATTVGIALHDHVHSDRWRVKTLADSFAVTGPAIATTISEQQAIHNPTVDEETKRLPSEQQLYSLTAKLVEVKKEFDGDYHLILEEPVTHRHMIAEIPDTSGNAPAVYKQQFSVARAAIDKIAGKPGMIGKKLTSPPILTLTGIGFFDDPHVFTPNGMSANEREMHPVLSVATAPSVAPVLGAK